MSRVCSFAVAFNYNILNYLRLNYLRLIYAQFLRHFLTAILLFLVLGCIIIIVWKGYGKIEMQCICKNYWWIFKISIPIAVGISKRRFLIRLGAMDQNSFFLDNIHRKAIKVRPTPNIKTTILVMALRQILPKPSFKSYVNNFSLCQACFLKLKFSCVKIF